MASELHSNDWEFIGAIIKPHGLNGEMWAKLSLHGHNSSDKLIGQHIRLVATDGKQITGLILALKFCAKAHLITLSCSENREQALALIAADLYVPRGCLARLPQDSRFIKDLIGLTCTDDITREPIGHVSDVKVIPGNPLLEIQSPGGSRFLLPYAACFVKEDNPHELRLSDWQQFAEL